MDQKRTLPTVGQVNLLLLISMALIVGGSIVMSGLPTVWVLLIRELLFILAPVLLMAVVLNLPARATMRLRWPGWAVVVSCALIGAGGWLLDTWLGVVFTELLGYGPPLPPDFFPTTPAQAITLFVVLAIVAPVCEEVLFRGVIQRGYEGYGPSTGILAGGVLFVLFHQSLPQGLGLVPLALLLGYVAWRSDSLLSSILVHAANNALAALIIILATADPEIAPFLGTLPSAWVGLALILAGLWSLHRWIAVPPPLPQIARRRGFGPWLARAWPLFLVVPLSLLAMAAEAVMGRFPEALSMGRPVHWADVPWDGPHAWTYEVRVPSQGTTPLDEPVGQVRCSLVLEETAFVLTCRRQQSAYEADTGKDVYYGGELDERFTARWQRPGLRLLSVDRRVEVDAGSQELSVVPEGDAVSVTVRLDDGSPETVRLPIEKPASLPWPDRAGETTVLEDSEWPWRLSALAFGGFYSAQASMVESYAWPEETGDNGTGDGDRPRIEPTHVIIYGAEPVKTPAGTFVAWRVKVGDDLVAWYDTEPPYTLVALDDSIETWVLSSAE